MWYLILEGIFFTHSTCIFETGIVIGGLIVGLIIDIVIVIVLCIDEGRYKFKYLVYVSFLSIVVSSIYCVVFLFSLTCLCVPYVASFSHLFILDCHFAFLLPKSTLYCIYYLKKLHLIKYFLIKDCMSEWRFLGLDPQRWTAASMKDDKCRCSGCPTPSSFLHRVCYCWIIRLYNILTTSVGDKGYFL
jgi:hypothetical protein